MYIYILQIPLLNDMIWVPKFGMGLQFLALFAAFSAPGSIDVPPARSMFSIGFIDDGLTEEARSLQRLEKYNRCSDVSEKLQFIKILI